MEKTQKYQALIEHISDLEGQVTKLNQELNVANKKDEHNRQVAERQQLQLKTLQTVSSILFANLDSRKIFQLLCDTLVGEQGWSGACVVDAKLPKVSVPAHAGSINAAGVDHIKDYALTNTYFREAYYSNNAISTLSDNQKMSLSLRSLFNAPEVMAMPLIYGELQFGMLVVCGDLKQVGNQSLDFLAVLCEQVARAVHFSHNYSHLEQQNVKLRQLDDIKNSFISITSHQLRTPLSIVKWILSVLSTDQKILELPEQAKLISQAYDSNERLIHVVNDLLNVSRIQEGRLSCTLQKGSINDVITDVWGSTYSLIENMGMKYILEIEDDLPEVGFDRILLKEALRNLIDNAVDYNEEKGFVKIKAYALENKVYIVITNPGPGISREDQKKIYDQFFRSEGAIRQQPSGNGLGLYLTKAIIKEHKGDMFCESDCDKETSFTITLPISK